MVHCRALFLSNTQFTCDIQGGFMQYIIRIVSSALLPGWDWWVSRYFLAAGGGRQRISRQGSPLLALPLVCLTPSALHVVVLSECLRLILCSSLLSFSVYSLRCEHCPVQIGPSWVRSGCGWEYLLA